MKRCSSTVLHGFVMVGWRHDRSRALPVVALPNPQRDGAWNPTLRKVREEWGTLGS
ncbi:MAG: hypothetical protein WCC89_06785 [Candidatus Sulfotelmatobacter sp.]